MSERISVDQIGRVYKSAIDKNLIDDKDTSVIFYDLSFLKNKIDKLISVFPSTAIHASAIKANPLTNILKFINDLNLGAEAASLPELYMAENAGFPPEKIFFDSPAKTIDEINHALLKGYNINADSLEELDLINEQIEKLNSKSKIGLRINPQVGTGAISSTSVAGEYSKFGVPVKYKKNEILNVYKKYNWLTSIHLHVGSQGMPVDMLVKGIGIVFDLVKEINNETDRTTAGNYVNCIDIGGGFPVSYYNNLTPVDISEYADLIKNNFPELFSNKYKLVTEFGRYIYANSGWAVSKIEYVKSDNNINTAITHLGADMFVRKSYNPEQWHHEISVIDKFGNLKDSTKLKLYNIAGPLCFAGDFIEKNLNLPELIKGDNIVIHDSGAYTLSMWSRYNSRQMPKIIGYYNNGEKFIILKEREMPEDLVNFWS